MLEEWRGNLWMVVEFSIISIVLWYAISCLLAAARLYNPSEGYDFTDIYVADLRWVQPGSPKYTDYGNNENTTALYLKDMNNLLSQLNNNPYVEIVGKSINGIPFSFNFNGGQISRIAENGDTLRYNCNYRAYDGNAVKALRISGTKGESPEEIAECINNGMVVISDYDKSVDMQYGIVDPDSFINRICQVDGRNMQIAPVKANFLRRVDYEPNDWSGILLYPLVNDETIAKSAIIRIKPGTDLQFKESMNGDMMRVGNSYLSNLQSVADIRETVQKSFEIEVLKQISTMAFLLLLVFLGILGTYWFRTQERVPEIAIRMTAGAGRSDIFRRLLSEGMILMAISAAIAMIFATLIIKKDLLTELEDMNLSDEIYYYGMLLTVAVLAVIVFLGIYFPARKAMKINPAMALKDK